MAIPRFDDKRRPTVQPGQKYCTQCYQPKSATGGHDLVSEDGMRRKWICADCGKRHGA